MARAWIPIAVVLVGEIVKAVLEHLGDDENEGAVEEDEEE